MRTSSKWLFVAVVASAAIALPAGAYNDHTTHPELTNAALQKSNVYEDPTLLFRLGLYPWEKVLIGTWIDFGSYFEDRGLRCRNHFYDPIFDRGLSIGCGFCEVGLPSWKWILEDEGQITFPEKQEESLADARTYLTRALTYNEGSPVEAARERSGSMISVFMNLGNTVHHIQDMAQPQHTRNDLHIDKVEAWGLNPLYNPSRYETYTLEQNARVAQLSLGGVPAFPGTPGLGRPRDFWTNATDTGIAQWTNRNFVSEGSNFDVNEGQPNTGTYTLPLPGAPSSVTLEELFAGVGKPLTPELQVLCGTRGVDCSVTMYSTPLTARASTLSIFDRDLRTKGLKVNYLMGVLGRPYSTERLFSLNNMNYFAAQEQLIPTAVGYSAGLINWFFRGKLEVGPPEKGPYAVVDHSTGQGFKTVKAKVKNATPNEKLANGTLLGIARFHVNSCYQPDLTGEFTQDEGGNLVTPCPFYRSNEEHIRIAAAQSTSLDVEQETELTFQFADPIPLNATDLVLQVYFQGKVGTEEGSFAVGAVDLSEPTFVSILNGTDTFELPTSSGGQFFYWRDIVNPDNIKVPPYSMVDINQDGQYGTPPDVDVRGGDIRYELSVEGEKAGTVTVPEGRFARLAVLVKPTTFELKVASLGNGFNQTALYTFPAKIGQNSPLFNVFYVTPVSKRRSQLLHNDSVTYYHYYLFSSAELKTMPPSQVDDATKLLKIEMEEQQLAMAPAFVLRELPPSSHGQDIAGLRLSPRVAPVGLSAKKTAHPMSVGAAAASR